VDFFASQDAARRQTKWLVVYFVLSVIAMVAVLYAAACFAFIGIESQSRGGDALPEIGTSQFWQPGLLLLVTLATVAIIGSGSLYKTFELWGGGEQVALQFGGRRLQPNSDDPAERRLLNVVEEMALASGISVPPVYVLDNEAGINAFAAGFSPNDAVIGVNRGTLDHLTRDELQGVMAHEFSHIFNGDMRLNLRLIGLLHGILLISIIGYFVLRLSTGFGGGHQRSSGDGKKGGGALPILVMGLAMWLIGSIGLLCARLIKSAISRQREYLADASAVQFTRNPDGIAGALKKIGGLMEGSKVSHPEAETASHMFFGPASRMSFGSLLATHPPLLPRIRRIDAHFDGRFPRLESAERSRLQATAEGTRESRARPLDPFGALEHVLRLNPVLALEAVGTVQPGMIEYAAMLMAGLPEPVRQAIHDPFSARLVVMIWLLDADSEIREKQLDIIRKREGDGAVEDLKGLISNVAACPDEARLPMLEVLQGALVSMSAEQYVHFRETIVELVRADQRVVLGEFIMKRILLTHLDRHFVPARIPTVKYMALSAVVDSIADLLSLMVLAGSRDPQQQMEAYRIGMGTLALKVIPNLRPKKDCSMERLDAALTKIEVASPTIKKRVLAALLAAAAHDEAISVREAELLRAVAVAIDCPLPPLLPGPTRPLTASKPAAGR
jgi:Zn-dependent protease with chaperone function